jgi:hypothetical protein
MSCTDAYREALTRQFAEVGREGVAERPLRRPANPGQDNRGVAAAVAVAESGRAMALAGDATVVHGEVIEP